jgi:hypothetical protein
MLNDATKAKKRCSALQPVEPAAAIFVIFKSLMSFSIYDALAGAGLSRLYSGAWPQGAKSGHWRKSGADGA